MSDERRIREPRKVVAALEIAQKARSALADGIEQNRETELDIDVLLYEMVRTSGAFVRFADVPPSRLEELIEFLRRVYAGLSSGSAPSIEEMLQRLCPESGSHEVSDGSQPESSVLQ